ncbi:phosphopeptide-binding protein [Phormidesmis priestleyi ULC007]|uniref:Phosphopeptide-binding protein n=1 Tax=Phormidesmis priestleyi ULC007 TaxID=1920490 RepID=A0A2T1D698_9CYAN|nr:FHA domain-containing protein [Phormidesmis priestleyi]PSB15954.1 phosphopeptide-binding protein [Phormidesmis priestleyi ULC007]PZO49852.1 MAG: FHA domain-containing protein [Phormidesmis priestleyi]
MSSESFQNHVLVVEDDQGRRELRLEEVTYSIGRDPKCDIRLASQFVSRRHATLLQLPNDDGTHHYRIVDGTLRGHPSANGLLINSRKLRTYDLQNGDEIIFGPHVRAIYYLLEEGTVIPASDDFDTAIGNVSPDDGLSPIRIP